MISSWILFTLMAAFMQSWRNAFQKQLSTTVDVYGVTLARFLFGFPFAAGYICWLYQSHPIIQPVHFTPRFWLYIFIAGCSQILATILMVMLFKQKNYAVGVGLAKSEAILAALVAVIFLHDHLSALGWVGVCIGGCAVFLLSKGSQSQPLSVRT